MEEYIKSGRALRERFEQIKYGRQKNRNGYEERYKALIQPLEVVGSKLGSQNEMLKDISTKIPSNKPTSIVGDIALKYLLKPQGQIDTEYGVYRDNDGLYIGNKTISVLNNDIYLDDNEGESYKGTRGLWELLTLNYPNSGVYDENDLQNYEEIVLKTDTYRPGNKSNARGIKTTKNSYKYKEIIQPILIKNEIIKPIKTISSKKGSGFEKIITNTPKEYVFWNSLDELLERFYILYGEIKAGNTNPNLKNEILNIIEEFKEL